MRSSAAPARRYSARLAIGGSVSGPSIAGGRRYVGLGDTFQVGFNGPGAIVALGL